MSNEVNTRWIEASQDNFREAAETANWSLAEAIIADTREAGFDKYANDMQMELTHARWYER